MKTVNLTSCFPHAPFPCVKVDEGIKFLSIEELRQSLIDAEKSHMEYERERRAERTRIGLTGMLPTWQCEQNYGERS